MECSQMMPKTNIQYTVTGFSQNYHDKTFQTINCDINTQMCTVIFQSGNANSFPTVVSAYNRQYGITVCPDKAWILMSDWDWGVYCYNAKTGQLVWKIKDSCVQGIFYANDHLVVHKANNALQKIDIATGRIQKCISSSVLESAFSISDQLLFVNRIGRYACLFNIKTFSILRKYKKRTINPKECLSLVIQSAYIENEALVIAGIEQYANGRYVNALDNVATFKRTVDPDLSEYLKLS